MPCYQSTNLPGGFSTTGRPSYKTEAECNQACQEGACCEGTTCSVKPACQCQGTGKVFKGVGTVCTVSTCECCTGCVPNQGSPCSRCWCVCGSGSAVHPRFINVTLSGTYFLFQPILSSNGGDSGLLRYKTKSLSATLTLTNANATTDSSVCPLWRYGNRSTPGGILPLGSGGASGALFVNPVFPSSWGGSSSACGVTMSWNLWIEDQTEFTSWFDSSSWTTGGTTSNGGTNGYVMNNDPVGSPSSSPVMTGPFASGVCFSSFTGTTFAGTVAFASAKIDLTINGMQQ